jgi:phosphatidylserine/phosphatidylglycerophosphate/cardiolipin synthase-like enzyme
MITAAKAYCNNEVAYLAWTIDEKIDDCLGFEVTRVYLDASGAPVLRPDGTEDRVKTAAYVAFEGQSNKDWNPQDTGVWPVQKMAWRDLTLRKRRDSATRRPGEVRVRYEIRPVGDMKQGLEPVLSNGRENVRDPATGQPKPAYQGERRPLGYLGAPVSTNAILVTSRRGPFRSTFTNGILAAQWLRKVLMEDGRIEKGELLAKLSNPDDKHRRYLAGDVLPLLHELFRRAGSFHLGLYELEDKELEQLLLDNADRVHVILSNTGKNASGAWDERNSNARRALVDAGIDVQPRMFNNSTHIGHNKFVVHSAPDGTPKAVFTGSTNWTSTGVAGQTNNALLIEDEQVARHFLAYWNRMHADALAVPDPLSAPMKDNQQGAQFRSDNRTPARVPLAGGARLTAWFSPNMPQRRKPKNPPLPPDLEEAYRLMRLAEEAIFFLAFYPGQRGKDCIIGEAVDIGRKDGKLIVMGAVSSPQAMPNYVPRDDDDDDEDNDEGASPSTFFERNVAIVRASRIEDRGIVGDFGEEVLSAGRAIIHDKVVVIDPFSAKSAVILGSHNLGFKASYSNDENMVIVEGDRALAEAYLVHVLDVYDHYRFRAVETELERQGKKGWSGFLQVTDRWQDPHLAGKTGFVARYLATRT